MAMGRYDDDSYRLFDANHLRMTWPGKDYYNPAMADTNDIHEPFADAFDRNKHPRMPWHDVHACVGGRLAQGGLGERGAPWRLRG